MTRSADVISLIPPTAAVALHHLFTFLWAPGAGRIVGEIARRQGLPYVQNGIDHRPPGFDHVGAPEQRLVADHTVVDQDFVSGGTERTEIISVVEIHIDAADTH